MLLRVRFAGEQALEAELVDLGLERLQLGLDGIEGGVVLLELGELGQLQRVGDALLHLVLAVDG